MGLLRVSNVLRPDNRVAAGPWVGWAHGGACSVCGRAQWPWRVLFCVCPGSAVARSACCRAWGPAVERMFCGCQACRVAHLLRAGRAYFRVQLGPLVCVFIFGRVSCGCLGAVAWRVFCARLWVFLFVMRWIIPLCLILPAFFPLFPERAETLRRNLLFEGTMLMR